MRGSFEIDPNEVTLTEADVTKMQNLIFKTLWDGEHDRATTFFNSVFRNAMQTQCESELLDRRADSCNYGRAIHDAVRKCVRDMVRDDPDVFTYLIRDIVMDMVEGTIGDSIAEKVHETMREAFDDASRAIG